MKKGEKVKISKSKLAPILISIIVVLVIILAYGIYSERIIREKVSSLESELNTAITNNDNLETENQNLMTNFDNLQKRYDLLYEDVQKIYKTCPDENACKGHFPGVSWYCNNVGDEISANEINNASHTCVCDSSCNMKTTEI